jgi:hypothetical protein
MCTKYVRHEYGGNGFVIGIPAPPQNIITFSLFVAGEWVGISVEGFGKLGLFLRFLKDSFHLILDWWRIMARRGQIPPLSYGIMAYECRRGAKKRTKPQENSGTTCVP